MSRVAFSVQRRVDRAVLAFCAVALAGVVAYPTLRMFWAAGMQWPAEILAQPAAWPAIRNTLFLSLASVASAGLLGTAIAFFFTRVAFAGRTAAAALAYLPFALPPLVGVLSFHFLIGPDGLLPRAIAAATGGRGLSLVGVAAILIVHTHAFCVYFYAMVSAALAGMDRGPLEAARTLGAGPARVFFRVTLPQLRPALLGASLLTFMSSAASFSAPFFLGNGLPVLTVEIYHRHVAADQATAFALTIALAAVSLCGVLLFRGRRQPGRTAAKGTPRPIRSGSGRVFAALAAWAVVGLLALPHLALLWLSFADYQSWGRELIPLTFTLENYRRLVTHPAAFAPIWNSLWMSGLGMAGALAVGAPAAYLIGRKRPGAGWIGLLTLIPWALPATVVAMNLIAAFNDPWLPLANTIWMLPLAYAIRNIPLMTRMTAAAVESLDGGLIEAARTLGAGPAYCLRRVAGPLLLPAVLSASALVFVSALGEFPASVLLAIAPNKPISVRIAEIMNDSIIVEASAYSVLLMVLVAAVFYITRRFSSINF